MQYLNFRGLLCACWVCLLCLIFTQDALAQRDTITAVTKQLSDADQQKVLQYAQYLLLKSKETDTEKARRLHKADNTIPSEETSQKIMEFSRFMVHQQRLEEEKMESRAKAEISFAHTTYDFKKVKEGDIVTHVFKFTNTSDVPLYVYDVKTSCGCTSSEWSKEAILPQASSQIQVNFDTKGRKGQQIKSVSISANTSPTITVLLIKGVIE